MNKRACPRCKTLLKEEHRQGKRGPYLLICNNPRCPRNKTQV